LSSHRINRDLGRCAEAVLGRSVSMREVQEAAIRFLLQLGVAIKSLEQCTGLRPHTLIRVAGLLAPLDDRPLITQYGIPMRADHPVFAELWRVMQRIDASMSGLRDRAILSLLYFDFATPEMVSMMDRDHVHADGTYSLTRGPDLTVTLAEHHVVQALGESRQDPDAVEAIRCAAAVLRS
jgi:hypothetical protein